jgi:hypothetical protein
VSDLPILLVSRTCDAVACDAAQDLKFRLQGYRTTPGNVAETWVETLRERVGDPSVAWRRITSSGSEVGWCSSPLLCTMTVAALNHLHWPDGVEDGSGADWEPEMLGFLRDHALAEPSR